MQPFETIFLFTGPGCIPAWREERPGEPEEGPGEEDQDAGVRAEAGEVRALRTLHSVHLSDPPSLSLHPHSCQFSEYSRRAERTRCFV